MKITTLALLLATLLCPAAFCGEIHDAARAGDVPKVEALLKAQPELVNATDSFGLTPLHWAAAKVHKDVVELLLAHHAPINVEDKEGKTPLQRAMQKLQGEWGISSREEIGALLRQHGGRAGRNTELFDAIEVGDLETVKARLKSAPDSATRNGRKDIVELLLADKADVNAKDSFGMTPLHLAAGGSSKDVAELLLAHQADVTAKSEYGATPLHSAAGAGNKAVAELLLAHQADVNAKNILGMTPLHVAAGGGHKAVAELLLSHKADVNAKDKDGLTPQHWAWQDGHKDIAELLLRHMKKE